MECTSPSGPGPDGQRQIEGWLPLAQDANERYGWGLDAAALEAIIQRAAARLGQAGSSLAAYAILWATYHRAGKDER